MGGVRSALFTAVGGEQRKGSSASAECTGVLAVGGGEGGEALAMGNRKCEEADALLQFLASFLLRRAICVHL